MTKTPQDPDIFRLLTEVGIIEQLARNQLERNLPDDLRMSQFAVLNHLVRLGGEWSPLRLATAFQLTKGAMTNTVQKLEARGFVKVGQDPNDGRGKLVSITEEGHAMRSLCVQRLAPLIAELSSVVPQSELKSTLPTLEKIRKHLDTNR
ncbi:MarR family transcriptional regulator [Magnetovibrio sp. PR-2]|uniref:MarR family winged helix-turn-helix transcriptional regulator n=1 Tax=Magnetovibrio sp. PR-2 TaxID=3120356 RepID=UPI002FCDE7DF